MSSELVLTAKEKDVQRWLREQAARHNLPVPDASLAKTRVSWQLTSRGYPVGRRLTLKQVERRDEALVEKLCEQVSVVKADIGRALDAPWAEIGRTLRIARDRVDIIVNSCTNAKVLFEVGATKESPNTYAVAIQADKDARAERLERLRTLQAKLEKMPKDPSNEEAIKKKAKCEADVAWCAAEAAFGFSGAALSMLSQRGESSFSKWAQKRRSERFPHVRRGQPIPLRADGKSKTPSWRLTREKGSFILEFKIGAGSTCRWKVKVHPKGGNDLAACRELTDGLATKRDAKIVWDEARKKWVVIMAIGRKRRPPPEVNSTPLTMVVRLGMRSLLAAWFSDGSSRQIINGARTGATLVGILARKERLLQDKKSKQRGMSELSYGPAAVRKTRRRKLGALGRKERAYVDSETKQIAAFVANLAESKGATRIIIQIPPKPFSDDDEKYMDRFIVAALKRFPLGELSSKIVWALDKRGLPSEVVDLGYDACTCPDCGHIDGRAHNPKTQEFRCTQDACALSGAWISSDLAAAINAMKRSGVSEQELKRTLEHAHATVRALKEKKEKVT